MYGKHKPHKHRMKRRKVLAFIVTMALLCSTLPARVIALASGGQSEYLCGHIHDESCGYVEGGAGTPCNHVHDENCCYVEGSPCADVHTHDESCGYREGAPCTYAHIHDESCGYNAETGEGCTDAHEHGESCGYVEAAPCGYVHTHDESCGYVDAVACDHDHNEDCGYVAAAPGTPCNHVCNILSFNNHAPGEAIDVYTAEAGETYDEICAALPETLTGRLACAVSGTVIPIRWICADFTGEAGTYTFRAEPATRSRLYPP